MAVERSVPQFSSSLSFVEHGAGAAPAAMRTSPSSDAAKSSDSTGTCSTSRFAKLRGESACCSLRLCCPESDLLAVRPSALRLSIRTKVMPLGHAPPLPKRVFSPFKDCTYPACAAPPPSKGSNGSRAFRSVACGTRRLLPDAASATRKRQGRRRMLWQVTCAKARTLLTTSVMRHRPLDNGSGAVPQDIGTTKRYSGHRTRLVRDAAAFTVTLLRDEVTGYAEAVTAEVEHGPRKRPV